MPRAGDDPLTEQVILVQRPNSSRDLESTQRSGPKNVDNVITLEVMQRHGTVTD